MFAILKKNDLQACERTIKLLKKYHAVPDDNEQFQSQYRHLFALRNILKTRKGKI